MISSEGKQLGIMPVEEALNVAFEEGLDLVEVASNADPPVCRIMDYGKYKYQTSKKVQEARKKGKAFQIKEIKFRPHTDEHDLDYKIRNLKRFLAKKNRVKLTVMFKGREYAYQEAGIELLNRVANEVAREGAIDQEARLEGRNVTMVLVPK
ncbi:MAG: translation initiation factor IF-3 [Deltaproteobacteria bacterium RBG_19FT_COMBO_46_9]|nr:MAG: translation initiation factor IF-3 [Deltaproteobacteria bacterium RBG_19FT_COMBO_46_9]